MESEKFQKLVKDMSNFGCQKIKKNEEIFISKVFEIDKIGIKFLEFEGIFF
jgi:hypothetical protein